MSFYEQFAAHYEKIFPFRETTWEFLRSRLPDQGRILDLGCGPGHYAGRFAAEDRLTAWGIDLDPAMVQAARENYPAAQFAVLDLRLVANLESPFTGAY